MVESITTKVISQQEDNIQMISSSHSCLIVNNNVVFTHLAMLPMLIKTILNYDKV